MVIRDKLFYNFIYRIFRIDPDERSNASELLKDPFLKVETPFLELENKYMYSQFSNTTY